jgi:uncharacterized protein YdeI (YjbR/CyaY-like superfamily)
MSKTITAKSRNDFRKWLSKNHDKESKVAVILYKKHTGIPSPSHKELMEEAICFGWIDTTIKKLDEERYVRNFSKRNKNSKWSDNTLSYAKELIKRKLMTPIGLRYYKEGLSRPTHDADIPKNPEMPKELKRALRKDGIAEENFGKFSPSTKRMLYRWLLSGKLEATRKKRVKQIVENAKQNKKISYLHKKKSTHNPTSQTYLYISASESLIDKY